MLDVRIKKRLVKVPENWEELKNDRKLYNYVMQLLATPMQGDVLLLQAMLRILGIPKWKAFMVPRDAATILTERLQYIIEDHPGTISENRFPKLGRGLHGTEHIWRDMLTWEYAKAESHFLNFGKTNDPHELDLFLAVWYRPRRWFTRKKDVRVKFDDSTYQDRVARLEKVPIWKKLIVWQYFLQLREDAVKTHPHLFSGKESNGEEASWTDTIIALSVPGNEDITGNVPVAITLRRLEMKAIEKKVMETKTPINEDF